VPTPVKPVNNEWVKITANTVFIGSSREDIDNSALRMCEDYLLENDKIVTSCDSAQFEDELLNDEVKKPESEYAYYADHFQFVSDFYINKYEVTNYQYAQCLNAGACSAPNMAGDNPRHFYFSDQRFYNLPVVYVSIQQAREYCRYAGGRLPRSEEWEKAAAFNLANPSTKNLFPWGNNFQRNLSNWRLPGQSFALETDTEIQGNLAKDVGSTPSDINALGVMDMAGNVAEWVESSHASGWVELRGSSWNMPTYLGRTANRLIRPNLTNYFDIGFRCVKDKP